MSMYHLMNGVNQVWTFFLLPILWKNPEEYPRFRDCIPHPNYSIEIYTRVWWWNRESYEAEIGELQQQEWYVKDYDDEQDSTYASFIFNIPDKFKQDFDHIMNREPTKTSKEYQELVLTVYPKLAEQIKEIFIPEKFKKTNPN